MLNAFNPNSAVDATAAIVAAVDDVEALRWIFGFQRRHSVVTPFAPIVAALTHPIKGVALFKHIGLGSAAPPPLSLEGPVLPLRTSLVFAVLLFSAVASKCTNLLISDVVDPMQATTCSSQSRSQPHTIS